MELLVILMCDLLNTNHHISLLVGQTGIGSCVEVFELTCGSMHVQLVIDVVHRRVISDTEISF
jgi:hypothetical protein